MSCKVLGTLVCSCMAAAMPMASSAALRSRAAECASYATAPDSVDTLPNDGTAADIADAASGAEAPGSEFSTTTELVTTTVYRTPAWHVALLVVRALGPLSTLNPCPDPDHVPDGFCAKVWHVALLMVHCTTSHSAAKDPQFCVYSMSVARPYQGPTAGGPCEACLYETPLSCKESTSHGAFARSGPAHGRFAIGQGSMRTCRLSA